MKRWTLLLAVFFLLAVLSACGGKAPAAPGTPGNSETPPETVTPVELPEDTNEDPAPPEIAEDVPPAVADTLAELIYNSPDTFAWRLIRAEKLPLAPTCGDLGVDVYQGTYQTGDAEETATWTYLTEKGCDGSGRTGLCVLPLNTDISTEEGTALLQQYLEDVLRDVAPVDVITAQEAVDWFGREGIVQHVLHIAETNSYYADKDAKCEFVDWKLEAVSSSGRFALGSMHYAAYPAEAWMAGNGEPGEGEYEGWLIKYAQFVMGQRSNGRWYLYDMGTGGYSPEHFPVEFP